MNFLLPVQRTKKGNYTWCNPKVILFVLFWTKDSFKFLYHFFHPLLFLSVLILDTARSSLLRNGWNWKEENLGKQQNLIDLIFFRGNGKKCVKTGFSCCCFLNFIFKSFVWGTLAKIIIILLKCSQAAKTLNCLEYEVAWLCFSFGYILVWFFFGKLFDCDCLRSLVKIRQTEKQTDWKSWIIKWYSSLWSPCHFKGKFTKFLFTM